MSSKAKGGITVKVRKGAHVHVEEVDDLRGDDPRVPHDRDVLIVGPKDVKVAIRGIDPDDVSGRADLTLRCG